MHGNLNEVAKWLSERDEIAITAHIAPDGDSIGSTLGLMHALRQMGKRCFVVMNDAPPRTYSDLPGAAGIAVAAAGMPFEPRSIIVLDCAGYDRVGPAVEPLLRAADDIACVDHHATSREFGSAHFIDSSAASTGEIIVQLTELMGVRMNREIADCLYTAIITDCGNFAYSYTSADTLRLAAKCVEAGVDLAQLSYKYFRERTRQRTILLGRALSGIEYLRGGLIAVIRVSMDMLVECGANRQDIDKIINFGIDTEGTLVSMLLEEDEGSVKVGFRSGEPIDCSQIALALGGGGHSRASGATVAGSMSDVAGRALDEINRALDAAGL